MPFVYWRDIVVNRKTSELNLFVGYRYVVLSRSLLSSYVVRLWLESVLV